MAGKEKCSILKQIRQRIAEENDIPYQVRECTHSGDCTGTCPHCESELRYLESQLKKRASLGKKIRLAAICAGMAVTVTGCSVIEAVSTGTAAGMLLPVPTDEIEVLSGEAEWPSPVEESGENRQDPADASDPVSRIVPTEKPVQVYVADELSGYVPCEQRSGS